MEGAKLPGSGEGCAPKRRFISETYFGYTRVSHVGEPEKRWAHLCPKEFIPASKSLAGFFPAWLPAPIFISSYDTPYSWLGAQLKRAMVDPSQERLEDRIVNIYIFFFSNRFLKHEPPSFKTRPRKG